MDGKKPAIDWNEGSPDHEGEMAVSQLHRVADMAKMMLEMIGKDDELPGWIQYKISRAYNDLSDAFGSIESDYHELKEAKKKKQKGLWANIHARRKAGKRPHKPGEKGYPKTLKIERVKALLGAFVSEQIKKP